MAYLCVTSIAGNATSALRHFIPMDICKFLHRRMCPCHMCVWSDLRVIKALTVFLPAPSVKPDPPSDVSVRQEEGQEMRMTVNWSLPISWMPHDHYYKLIYEIQYRPLKSSFWQVRAGRQIEFLSKHCWCVCVHFSHFSSSMHCWLFWPETIKHLSDVSVMCVHLDVFLYVPM